MIKRWDEMTVEEQNKLDDGMTNIAKLRMHIDACHQDLSELYRVKNWTDATHDAQQRLYRMKDDLNKELEQAIWNEIKSCNGCIHLELTSLKRENDKNSPGSQAAIMNIEHFANQITNLTN